MFLNNPTGRFIYSAIKTFLPIHSTYSVQWLLMLLTIMVVVGSVHGKASVAIGCCIVVQHSPFSSLARKNVV